MTSELSCTILESRGLAEREAFMEHLLTGAAG